MSCNKDFLNTFPAILIDKTDPLNPLAKEQYWRDILQRNIPQDINIADGV